MQHLAGKEMLYQRPSAGFGAIFLLLSIGQSIEPLLVGLIAGQFRLSFIFYLAGALTAATALVGPRVNIRAAAPDS